MKILEEFPPNYSFIEQVFKNCERDQPIFCYGDTIYNPFKRNITADLEAHEEAHMRQQGDNPEAWWNYYLSDKDFRLEQEIEAYGTQYAFAKKWVKNNKITDWLKEKLAQSLSSDLYGNLLTYHEAESKIKHYAKEAIL